jgi:hypothetical protein
MGGPTLLEQYDLIKEVSAVRGGQDSSEPIIAVGAVGRGSRRERDMIEPRLQSADGPERAFDHPLLVVALEQARLRLRQACDEQEREEWLHKTNEDAVQVHGSKSLRVANATLLQRP